MPASVCLNLILTTDILGGIICTWTQLIPGGWFYAIMLAALEISLFIKLDNMTSPAVFGIFISVLMIAFLPTVVIIIPILIMIVNIAVVLFALYTRRD